MTVAHPHAPVPLLAGIAVGVERDRQLNSRVGGLVAQLSDEDCELGAKGSGRIETGCVQMDPLMGGGFQGGRCANIPYNRSDAVKVINGQFARRPHLKYLSLF